MISVISFLMAEKTDGQGLPGSQGRRLLEQGRDICCFGAVAR
jgi:hypothetical protein